MTTQPHGEAPGGEVVTMGLHKIVAANVRAEMARQMISQTRIAEALGIAQQLVSNRVKGKTPFSIDELAIVANVLGVSIADLVANQRSPRPDNPDGGLVCAARDSNPEPSDLGGSVFYLAPIAA